MKPSSSFISIVGCVTLAGMLFLSPAESAGPRMRIYIVSSYHPEYLWSKDTAAGVGKALLDFHFLDNEAQAQRLDHKFYVESSKSVIKKAWMDTKHKSTKAEIADTTARIVNEIKVFHPDLIMLGDDNAVNYIGNQFMDTEIPIVFWGVNGKPIRYGLLDSLEQPGHNVTGIYQVGYIKEALEYLLKLQPQIKTIAVLCDGSETGRIKAKNIEMLDAQGQLPVKIVEVVSTNSYLQWQEAALRLSKQVDGFYLANHNTLHDEKGQGVDQMVSGAWYFANIRKPDFSDERQFAQEGVLLVVDDSGFKQGYEAVRYANDILNNGKQPAQMPVVAPSRGAVIVNRVRAAQLGISLDSHNFIEEYYDKALANREVSLEQVVKN